MKSKHIIIYFLLLSLLIMLSGCIPRDKNPFWYPIKLVEATCAGIETPKEYYLMTNTTSWRSWPYYLDPTDKKEVRLGEHCNIKIIRELQRYKSKPQESLMSGEQAKYIIKGL